MLATASQTPMVSDEELRAKARKTAEEKVGFFVHLGIYIGVNLFIIGTWAVSSGIDSFPWPVFVLLPWGIGLIAHFVGAFAGPSMIETMTEKEFRRMKGQ